MFSKPWLIGAIVISVVLQILAEYLPFIQAALDTVPLGLQDLGLIVLVFSSVLVADEMGKLIGCRTK